MLNVGKLDSELLKKLVFENMTFKREEVLARPGIGEDCAVVDYGKYECVLSTDPITAAVENIGHLAVNISCNDIASNGIEPLGILLAVMLPVGTTEEQIELMIKQAGETGKKLGVEIIGGHTEITFAVNQPVIVSTAVGRGLKGSSENAAKMETGDFILITKAAGIEGTSIIAEEKDLSDILSSEEIEVARGFSESVSVVKEGIIAGKIGTHGMHDITEGGVLGAVWEMCQIAGLGCEIYRKEIPVDDITLKICDKFDINPLRLISSGSMMIACSGEQKKELMERITEEGIRCTCIGKVMDKDFGIKFDSGDVVSPPGADELYKAID